MNLNWIAIGVAFLVTIVIAVISGIYLPKNVGLIGPIIGGLIAGYIVGGSYTDGIVNGGIPAGIAGLIYILAVVLLLGSQITTAAINAGYVGSIGTLTAAAAIGGAFVGFCIYFVLGLIGGIIGVAIKQRRKVKTHPPIE
jgi:Family of unknown function (DUF5518)